MNLSEFVLWLASAGALGAISSFLFQALKVLIPGLEDRWAKIGSVVFAAVLSVIAQQVVPLLPQVPEWVTQLWPMVVWLWQQLTYELIVKRQPA